MASVLHIQGTEPIAQPVVDSHGNMLLWNGEVFGGISIADGESDTSKISDTLGKLAESNPSTCGDFLQTVATALSEVHGPYAFIYYNAFLDALCYGRDPFGRRSLLVLKKSLHSEGSLVLSSCCTKSVEGECWEELPIGGLSLARLSSREDGVSPEIISCPWPHERITLSRRNHLSHMREMRFGHPSIAAPEFLGILKRAIARRVNCVVSKEQTDTCNIGVLFSGGIDSVLLAAALNSCVDPALSIDLLNVTFDEKNAELCNNSKSPSPDRLAAIVACRELKVLCS